MKEFFCGSGTALGLECGGRYANLYAGGGGGLHGTAHARGHKGMRMKHLSDVNRVCRHVHSAVPVSASWF